MDQETNGASKPLGEYLRELGLLSETQVRILLYEQRRSPNLRFGDLAKSKGWVDQRTLDLILHKQCRSRLQSLLNKPSN